LEQVQELKDEQQNKVTEKTDMKKVNIPEFAKPKKSDDTFVSKVKPKS
jgi:hypothetical protein